MEDLLRECPGGDGLLFFNVHLGICELKMDGSDRKLTKKYLAVDIDYTNTKLP
jgi:hypothetical protein